MIDEHWTLQSNLNPEAINDRLEILVSGKGVRNLLAQRGTAPRVPGATVAPDWIPIARTRSTRFGVSWEVYPPKLSGTIGTDEFLLFPALGTAPELSGTLVPGPNGTRIQLRVEGPSAEKVIVAIAAISASFVWIVASASLLTESSDGGFRWELLIPCVLIPTVAAIAFALWRQIQKSNRQLVELLCEALDANVLSGPPPPRHLPNSRIGMRS